MPASPGDAALAELLREPVVRRLAAVCGDTECHLVGGVLRDRLLGLPSLDLDLVVAGRGREIAARLASELPARLVPLGGKDFAAYRLVARGLIVDLWDRAGTPLRQDLARRDFTLNSMALALEAEHGAPRAGIALADPFGGRADLAARRLRATTPESFTGDPLRILRLARLLVQLPAFTAEVATVELARQAAHLLPQVAAERIRVELGSIFAHDQARRGLQALAATGVYPALWLGPPEVSQGDGSKVDDRAVRAARAALADLAALPRAAAELQELLGAALEIWPASSHGGPAGPAGLEQPLAGSERASALLQGESARSEGEPHGLKNGPAESRSQPSGSQIRPEGPDTDSPDQIRVDFLAARLALTFLDLPATTGGPAQAVKRFRAAGYLPNASADEVAALLPLLRLPRSATARRRYLYHAGPRWATVMLVLGARALRRGGSAPARWRREAAALARMVREEGGSLFFPPRLLDGSDVQQLLALPPGPEIGRILAALTAAQVEHEVRTREEAVHWLRRRRPRKNPTSRSPARA
jgi:poly(A) polymerase